MRDEDVALSPLKLDIVREVVLRRQHAGLPDQVAGHDHAYADPAYCLQVKGKLMLSREAVRGTTTQSLVCCRGRESTALDARLLE